MGEKMSSPKEVAAKVWGGNPKDWEIIDEESLEEAYKNGVKAERLWWEKTIKETRIEMTKGCKIKNCDYCWGTNHAFSFLLEKNKERNKEPEKEEKVK